MSLLAVVLLTGLTFAAYGPWGGFAVAVAFVLGLEAGLKPPRNKAMKPTPKDDTTTTTTS